MYYSAGTYEAFAHPEKPKDVDKKSAYIIGTGLAGLTAAFYLVRDGQMKGEHIHVFEKLDLAGGSCDGRKDVTKGFFMRGGREMDNHFEVMWDTFRDVPSIETPGVSVLDEYYWLNKHDPNYSLCRASVNCGEDAHTDKQFKLDKDSAMALSKLFLTPEKDLEDKKISDVLPDSFWSTNFWLYWQTMFAFQRWSSALEMKRYLCRYVHHIDGLPDFSALRFTKGDDAIQRGDTLVKGAGYHVGRCTIEWVVAHCFGKVRIWVVLVANNNNDSWVGSANGCNDLGEIVRQSLERCCSLFGACKARDLLHGEGENILVAGQQGLLQLLNGDLVGFVTKHILEFKCFHRLTGFRISGIYIFLCHQFFFIEIKCQFQLVCQCLHFIITANPLLQILYQLHLSFCPFLVVPESRSLCP